MDNSESTDKASWNKEMLHIFCDLCIKAIDMGMRPNWRIWMKLIAETGVGWSNELGTIAASDDARQYAWHHRLPVGAMKTIWRHLLSSEGADLKKEVGF
uniref:Myb/SANT-like domain-containing protein n=1 Tax=Salix viminalis TaxID=40686 RepID=A0A6N2MFW7_SALVM